MPTADTSRAALQALAGVLEEASGGLSSGDFAVTINVTAAGAVLDASANYQPHSIQRLTLAPTGELRVSAVDPFPALFGPTAWGTVNFFGDAWGGRR